MKLKKVEILGFKSFAEKTVIEFHDGITCIVGPNGCGKSNIGDAIRWVLGEQSAKAMRGGKMPDVIFGGAVSKKALNFAEVTITFDEVNGALPLDFDEVAITRRLHRNGDSEYFINKQLVRLKDVHSLFLDSGIGKNNISFFEQGKIDQLIQYSPIERRYIFEEAAGIVRFLQRKKETLRKLEEVGVNLSRVNDIRGEVEKQIFLLEGQAKDALIFKEKKHQLEIFEKEHLLFRYQTYAKRKADLVIKESIAEQSQKEFTVKKDHLETALQEKKHHFEKLDQAHFSAREQLLVWKNEKNLKELSQVHAEERILEHSSKEQKITLEIRSLETDQMRWVSEIAFLKEKKEALNESLKCAKLKRIDADLEFQALEKEQQILRKEQTEAYREKASAYQKESSLQNEVKQLIYRLEANLEKKDQFETRAKNLFGIILEKEKEVIQKKEVHLKAESFTKQSEGNLQRQRGRLIEAEKNRQSNQKNLENIAKTFHEKAAKLKALIHLRNEFTGFGVGGKKLLQESQNPKSPVFGLLKGLYEYINPKIGYESVVSVALKAYAETLVVATKADLESVLARAKTLALPDFSIICLESLSEKDFKSPFIASSELGSHLLGPLIIQETLNEALLDGTAFWVASQYFVDSKGVLFVGGAKETTVFMREAEIKVLESELAKLSSEKESFESLVNLSLKSESEIKLETVKADKEMRLLELRAQEAGFSVQRSQIELDLLFKEKNQVEDEIKSLLEVIQSLSLKQQQMQGEFTTANTKLDTIQLNLTHIENTLHSKSQIFNDKKQALQEIEKQLHALDADFRKVSYQFNVLETKNSETERLVLRLKGDLESLGHANKEWRSKSKASALDLSQIITALDKSLMEVNSLEQTCKRSKDLINEDEKQLKIFEKSVKEAENKMHQVGIQLAHVETGQNAVVIEMQERFDAVIDPFEEPHLGHALEFLENEIQVLKEFIDKNQNVNLAAIEQCAKQKERGSFLSLQVADLDAAKSELFKMIKSLDEESRILFKATFEEIRKNFQKNFQILFQGGEADLELLESTDVLEAGIEITAKPPGKQMRSLSLLSGGEKCLTAMALLFAVFEVKSSPFCILDEIDAPLDDSNVERFLNVVKQFIDRCQFIIVTHNKRTMALADRLYGVSMEEKGISKLLFMDFAEKMTQTVEV